MMGRRRNCRHTGSDSKCERIPQCSYHPFSDLPRDILVKILLKLLSVKQILACKCVCKSWYDIILDPEFAKLHFDQAEVCPLLESSNSLYLVTPVIHELKLGMCDRVRFELESIFKLPSKRCFVVNSCNGLLLLRFQTLSANDLICVCNPITGELINLPESKKSDSDKFIEYHGLGFSSISNQYKVIRTFRPLRSATSNMMVEVHILGTKSWKDTGLLTLPIYALYPTYVCGFLYWSDYINVSRIVSFDIENECFQSIKGVDHIHELENVSMGQLGLELCVSGFHRSGAFHVWVMIDHCENTWTQVLSMDMSSYRSQLRGPLQPVKYMNDGSLLTFNSDKKALIFIDSRKHVVRCLEVHGTKLLNRAIAHIPSFVSLEHALSTQKEKVKVFIHRPRFADLQREVKDVYLVEKKSYPLYSDSASSGNWSLRWDQKTDCEDRDHEIDSEEGNREFDFEDIEQLNSCVRSDYCDENFDYEDGHQEFGS